METEKNQSQHERRGKPWKKASRVHGKLAKACLTETEKLLLKAKARAAGMSESEWLRAAIRQRVVVARLTPGEAAFMRHLTLLYQLAHQARQHARQHGLTALETACRGICEEISHLLSCMDCDDRESQHE